MLLVLLPCPGQLEFILVLPCQSPIRSTISPTLFTIGYSFFVKTPLRPICSVKTVKTVRQDELAEVTVQPGLPFPIRSGLTGTIWASCSFRENAGENAYFT